MRLYDPAVFPGRLSKCLRISTSRPRRRRDCLHGMSSRRRGVAAIHYPRGGVPVRREILVDQERPKERRRGVDPRLPRYATRAPNVFKTPSGFAEIAARARLASAAAAASRHEKSLDGWNLLADCSHVRSKRSGRVACVLPNSWLVRPGPLLLGRPGPKSHAARCYREARRQHARSRALVLGAGARRGSGSPVPLLAAASPKHPRVAARPRPSRGSLFNFRSRRGPPRQDAARPGLRGAVVPASSAEAGRGDAATATWIVGGGGRRGDFLETEGSARRAHGFGTIIPHWP